MNNTKQIIDTSVKVAALFLTLYVCYTVLKPFILPLVWAAILAIALFPAHKKLSRALGKREKTSATLIALIGIALLVVPSAIFATSTIESATYVMEESQAGTLEVPPPGESVKDWPLVGEKLYTLWSDANADIQDFFIKHIDQIKNALSGLFGAIAGIGATVLQMVLSLIIAAVFLVKAQACQQGCIMVFKTLMGEEHGNKALETSILTVRSVAVGILGVAAIQAFLSGIGLMFAGIPGAGVWVLLVLLFAIMQLPPIIVLGPIAAYYFSIADTTPAIIFLVYAIIVSGSDAFLKPMFLGRGMDTPMLVILLGALGGMMASGIIGLFAGAVVLALGYQLLIDWLETEYSAQQEES
ncbi:AI-2E family transporter [Thalassotalea agarivorans]|uniref:Predicted PurR-regulated permease PerM n=1 Tax=Thalassotalea agarivorans TaxID=349064 RepID=A0A1H9YBX2_THASX|nr:AI-2E family transporter [Thalassotalea agarivorans]SES66462.1 Predicted PurR-regulated permease PerM [Thalassotalea agarivorans]